MSNVVSSGFKSLNQDKLFGQIPRLSTDLKRVSNRLSDQVELLKEKGYEDGYNAGYENGLKAGNNEGRSAGFIMAQNQAEADRKLESKQFFADWETLRQEFEQAEAAYHWASKASAANAKGTVTWLAAYRQLLMDVGSLPSPEAVKP